MIFIYPGTLMPRVKEIQKALAGKQIAWLSPDMKHTPMKEIAAHPSFDLDKRAAKGIPFVFCAGEEIDEISRMQSALEAAHLPLHAMAIATNDNAEWTLGYLMEEVGKEAEYFARRDRLADLLKAADPQKMRMDEDYANCHMLALRLLQEDELSESMLDTALRVIESFHTPHESASRG